MAEQVAFRREADHGADNPRTKGLRGSKLLSLRHVSKSYGGRALPVLRARPTVPVLTDVSFNLGRGEIMVLRGPNGCGKTTLLKIIADLVSPTEGDVWVDGELASANARTVGFSSGEERSLYWRLDARHNLEFFAALYGLDQASARSRADSLLTALDLTDEAATPVRSLSSGQKQRLLVARALIGNPSLILLDEPTGRMDEEAAALVWALLHERAAQGAAILLATHRDTDMNYADVVASISDHRVQLAPEERTAAASADPVMKDAEGRSDTSRPGLRGILGGLWSFVRRDLAITLSYPFALVGQVISAILGSALLFYLSRVVGSSSHYLSPYGGNYFAFAVLGTAAAAFTVMPVYSLPTTVREGQLAGTLEALLITPLPLSLVLVGSVLWPIGIAAMFDVILLLLVSLLIFGMPLYIGLLPLAALALLLGLAATFGLGFLEVAFMIVFKRGSPINLLTSFATNLLGGVLYPIAVLPLGLQVLSGLLPVTHAANAMRLAAIAGNASGTIREILVLLVIAAVYLAVGLVGLRLALRVGRALGTLGQY